MILRSAAALMFVLALGGCATAPEPIDLRASAVFGSDIRIEVPGYVSYPFQISPSHDCSTSSDLCLGGSRDIYFRVPRLCRHFSERIQGGIFSTIVVGRNIDGFDFIFRNQRTSHVFYGYSRDRGLAGIYYYPDLGIGSEAVDDEKFLATAERRRWLRPIQSAEPFLQCV